MSIDQTHTTPGATKAIIGEPEVVEDGRASNDSDTGPVEHSPAWLSLKQAAIALQSIQTRDGSIPDAAHHVEARKQVSAITAAIAELRPWFRHDADYLEASVRDFQRWAEGDFGVPDFLDSLVAFQPQKHRIDGIRHLVVFPMYTPNGSPNRFVEALLVEVIWAVFIE